MSEASKASGKEGKARQGKQAKVGMDRMHAGYASTPSVRPGGVNWMKMAGRTRTSMASESGRGVIVYRGGVQLLLCTLGHARCTHNQKIFITRHKAVFYHIPHTLSDLPRRPRSKHVRTLSRPVRLPLCSSMILQHLLFTRLWSHTHGLSSPPLHTLTGSLHLTVLVLLAHCVS